MEHHPHSVELTAIIPTRGLIGFETVLVNTTKGLGIIIALFHGYGPHKGEIRNRGTGVLVSMENGVSTAYALDTIRSVDGSSSDPQEEIYEGMIVGENAATKTCP